MGGDAVPVGDEGGHGPPAGLVGAAGMGADARVVGGPAVAGAEAVEAVAG